MVVSLLLFLFSQLTKNVNFFQCVDVTSQLSSSQEASGSPVAKRSRGRPKGSKNKGAGKSKVSGLHKI